MNEMSSDLLAPTLQDHRPRDPDSRPWRLGSQVYLAILGGVFAVTPIAVLNARKLGMPKAQVRLVVAAGLAGVVALGVYALVFVAGGEVERGTRLGGQLIGVAAWAPMYLLQRPWDRVYATFSPGEDDDEAYEPLWGPGLAAIIAGNVLLALILVGAAG
jgi:hypothetical protein